jgi:hypothetical protein
MSRPSHPGPLRLPDGPTIDRRSLLALGGAAAPCC